MNFTLESSGRIHIERSHWRNRSELVRIDFATPGPIWGWNACVREREKKEKEMRIFLAMALAASLFVVAGCSCKDDCYAPVCPTPCEVVEPCNPCAAPAYVVPAPAPAPVACNPCAGF